ncbi:heparan-sulfate 6-O-sulfotransferase 3-B-like [Lytechinus pictus]|uniref:heparan-sulfate 6-O-sulfotransferase 3-B-like n=1 Tax=Lytechinus pictus TaxID=7653 RepID=UPI0030BA0726
MQPFPSILRKWRYGFILSLLLTLALIFYNCSSERKYVHYGTGRHSLSITSTQLHQPSEYHHKNFPDDVLDRDLIFNINGNDVIVFLHIQKTGGTTLGKHLTRNLDLSSPCECIKTHKRCSCYRPSSKHQIWLFSRMSTGWLCGLHADWTELQGCVPEAMDKKERIKVRRRYFYITMVRNPVSRYISEWRHTQRGATWKMSRHMCGGHAATEDQVPRCFKGSTWMGVTLNDFMSCPHNMANNRQTRMLADLTLVNCYNKTGMSTQDRNLIMLASAKANLQSMAFFGLTEFQRESQYLFERTFKIKFNTPLYQSNLTIANASPMQESDMEAVRAVNPLDLELYAFAKDLFFQRYHFMKLMEREERENNGHHPRINS